MPSDMNRKMKELMTVEAGSISLIQALIKRVLRINTVFKYLFG